MTQLVHFYQTGTFTAGNRLLDPEDRSIQSSMERFNSLTSGHRACQGCGEALGARYAVDAAMRAVNGRVGAAQANRGSNITLPVAWRFSRPHIQKQVGNSLGSTHFLATLPRWLQVWRRPFVCVPKRQANR